MTKSYKFGSCFLTVWAATLACSHSAEALSPPPAENSTSGPEKPAASVWPTSGPALENQKPATTIWQDGVGEGFRSNVQTFSVESGVGIGMEAFGSSYAHDLALTGLSYGHMWGPVRGKDHWYRGNFEYRIELFGGVQYSPSSDWLVGLTPHLRYNFATGTRWIPFFDAGAGVSATSISHPDLGGTFEFNLQPGVGMHWFVRDNLALTGEVKFFHVSCAGISKPNHGVNDVLAMIGLTWFFGK
jgi:lipid A 3-O-deacylase